MPVPLTDDERRELVEARMALRRQLELVSQPMNRRDQNPALVSKLEAMIADVEAALAPDDQS